MTNESYKAAVAARINSIISERMFLDKVEYELRNQLNNIHKRIDLIDKQIIAEKESVKDLIN